MKALVYKGPQKVTIEEVQIPRPEKGEVLLQVISAGLCGTDMHVFQGHHPRGKPGTILGHEFIGRVMTEGQRISTGERVVVEPLINCGRCSPCREGYYNVCEHLGLYGIDAPGGLAEYVVVAEERLYPLPPLLTDKKAVLVEPLAVAIHAVQNSSLQRGQNVFTIGGGPIGFFINWVCKWMGAEINLISEKNPARRRRLAAAGLQVLDPTEEYGIETVRELTREGGVHLLFETAGTRETLKEGAELVKTRGQMILVAIYPPSLPFDFTCIPFRELRIIGSRTYRAQDFKMAIQLLTEKEFDTTNYISHHLSLDEAAEGFHLLQTGEDVMKIVIDTA